MRSRRSIRRNPEKRDQLTRDNTKLKVIEFLYFMEAATRNYINNNCTTIKKQSDDNFKEILDEMVEDKWLRKTQVGDMTSYTVLPEGKDALDKVKELVKDHHPLSKLFAFRDIE